MTLIHGCALEELKKLDAKTIDLVLIDPPYNIGKDKKWDKWKKQEDYINWLGGIFKECERVLKDTGSFYFFHNDFLSIVDLQRYISANTSLVFKQLIVWDKRFKGSKLKGYLDGYVSVDGLRNYKKMAEYCLFYTFQDETGLNTVMLDTENFKTLRTYFKELQAFTGLNKSEIIKLFGQSADHCFRWGSSQWDLPTPETYSLIRDVLGLKDAWPSFREYESLRQEYESLRYTFNNLKTSHSVWQYEIAPRLFHVTPKPVDLLENIIRHSSNPGDTVLDCFMGSGSTGVACLNTGRKFIGVEKNGDYFVNAWLRLNGLKV